MMPLPRLPLFSLPTLSPLAVPNPNPASTTRQLSLSFLFSSIPIPTDLALEEVLSDHLCHPLSLADFHTFLAFSERSGENLAFVLWFREYERRFWALDEEERGKAEVVEPREEWEEHVRRRAEERREGLEKPHQHEGGEGTVRALAPWEDIDLGVLEAGGAGEVEEGHQEEAQDQGKLDADTLAIAPWIVEEVEEEDKARMREIMAGAEEELEKTVQLLLRDDLPLRDEIVRVVLHFLTLSSPHALSSQHIPALLLTLRRTTHPYSFRLLYQELYTHLLLDAHPRFLRAALVNTRPPFRTCMYAIALGFYLCGGVALGLALVLCAGEVSRGWRTLSLPLVWAGCASPLCLMNGICPLAFGTKRRQLALWESMPGVQPPSSPPSDFRPPGQNVNTSEPGMFDFLINDPWATHPAARRMQAAVMRAAAGWGLLAMGLWAAVILAVPGRG